MKKKDNNLSLKKANDMCRIQRIQVHSTIKMKRKKDRCKVFSITYRHCSWKRTKKHARNKTYLPTFILGSIAFCQGYMASLVKKYNTN